MYALYRKALLDYDPDPDITHPGPDFLVGAEGDWRLYYAPLEYVNPFAKVLVLGAMPGFDAWRASVLAARNALREGLADGAALKAAQRFGVCSLEQRRSASLLLEACGLPEAIGLAAGDRLFERADALFDWATPLDGVLTLRDQPYSGVPDFTSPFMQERLLASLGNRLALLPGVPVAAFGKAAEAALNTPAIQKALGENREVLHLPALRDPVAVTEALEAPEKLPRFAKRTP